MIFVCWNQKITFWLGFSILSKKTSFDRKIRKANFSNMNFPRHEFSKDNTDLLLEFLKLSKENKSDQVCNLEEYEHMKKYFPLVSIEF